MVVDWSNPKSKISKYFTVREACWLPKFGVLHKPNAAEKTAILEMAHKMDWVRDFLGKAITVHCWLRPKVVNAPGTKHHKQDYNTAVGGAPASGHIPGKGVDWSCSLDCDEVRALLEPKLEELQLRMEDAPGTNWVHLDMKEPGRTGKRFFKP